MTTLSEEDFKAWWSHPVTQDLIQILHAKREDLRQQWEGGSFTDYDSSTTALVNVGNLGTCKGYAFITDLDYDTFKQELDDAESKRAGAPRRSSTNPTV